MFTMMFTILKRRNNATSKCVFELIKLIILVLVVLPILLISIIGLCISTKYIQQLYPLSIVIEFKKSIVKLFTILHRILGSH